MKEKPVSKKKPALKKPVSKKAVPKAAKPRAALKSKVKVEVKVKKAAAVKPKPLKPAKKVPAAPVTPVIKEAVPPQVKAEKVVHPVIKEEKPAVVIAAPELKELELDLPITVKDLSVKLQEKPSIVIKSLMDIGKMSGINQSLDEETLVKICSKFKFKFKKAPGKEKLALGVHEEKDDPRFLKPRAPIVTFMGHVDHGKTLLMDQIRKTNVVDSEHGGITQHIGAYRVKLAHGEITFLDTPGHEAFTAMRARGAGVTDIVVLVVAADDGVMPQTEEAIDHARAAGVPIIVALNKVDKPQADTDRVKKQLAKFDLASEDWGGKTITVPVSAKTGAGIEELLEMILLEAQMLELKSNPNRIARGVVIEAKITKGRGPASTLLVQNGTLHLNENIIVGDFYGKIRAMFDDKAHSVKSAGPGVPVEVLGISGVPHAGETFFVVEDERTARDLAQARQEQKKQQQMRSVKRISLEDLHAEIQAGKIKELNLIIKSDVQGSLEAIKETLGKLNVSEIRLNIMHAGVGNINSSDVVLAMATNALILGFNVVADELARQAASKEGIEIKIYNIIYELANQIKAAVEGMLEPKINKVFLGKAEVRKVFDLTKAGRVAGCYISKGKINRQSVVSLLRGGEPVFEGKVSSLKRFKDDVREVAEGYECGISLSGFTDLQAGDIIEAYEIEKIARKL
ncbi:MAG: translation initiation factor IF-2 [Candidatus Omnitrophica bacterium]|nr:translation initiation factor IF-2 [Candidatus Omnitrophota bacterium]MBL7210278.1 translation initiation factor IF-2 [Candidatus Omnitrophota bacterium]